MSDELFPPAEVQQTSPRLAWIQKYGVVTRKSKVPEHVDMPWCAWFKKDEHVFGVAPHDRSDLGYGNTEENAIVSLAKNTHILLWNEE